MVTSSGPVIATVSFLVPDYDTGIRFFTGVLGFDLVEDKVLSPGKRWVLVRPPGGGPTLLLAAAKNADERAAIGNQTGGRVFLFLETGDFPKDYQRFRAAGLKFLEEPRQEAYGTVAVFQDPFGNKWDLIGRQP